MRLDSTQIAQRAFKSLKLVESLAPDFGAVSYKNGPEIRTLKAMPDEWPSKMQKDSFVCGFDTESEVIYRSVCYSSGSLAGFADSLTLNGTSEFNSNIPVLRSLFEALIVEWDASEAVIGKLMFFYALSITELAVVQALGFTAPLFATVLAMLLLREKVRLRRWVALIIGFTGVLIVLRPGAVPIGLGPMLVLGSAAVWALTMIIIKRLSNTDSPLTITAWVAIFLTVLSLPTALFVWQWPQGWQWGILLFTAITGTFGQLLLTKAFAYAEASIVMPFDFAKILWSASLGYWIFGEYVSVYTWIGAVVIFSGACYVAIREHQLEQADKRNRK